MGTFNQPTIYAYTIYAYGVKEQTIRSIKLNNALTIFYMIASATNFGLFKELAGEDADIFSPSLFCEMPEKDAENAVKKFYETVYHISFSDVRSAVLADVVSRMLNIPLHKMVVAANSAGGMIVGIPYCIPWEIPERLRNITRENVRDAFQNAFEILGVDCSIWNRLPLDKQSILDL